MASVAGEGAPTFRRPSRRRTHNFALDGWRRPGETAIRTALPARLLTRKRSLWGHPPGSRRVTGQLSEPFLRESPLPRHQLPITRSEPVSEINVAQPALSERSATLLADPPVWGPSSVHQVGKESTVVDYSLPHQVSEGDLNPHALQARVQPHSSPRPCADPEARRRDAVVRTRIRSPPLPASSSSRLVWLCGARQTR
jgi:hypothetical protein